MSAQPTDSSFIWGIQAEPTWKTAFYSQLATTGASHSLTEWPDVVPGAVVVSRDAIVPTSHVVRAANAVYAKRDRRGLLVFGGQELSPTTTLWQSIKPLMRKCSVSHQAISTDEEVLGGIPHIAGTRLSVGQVLGRLYVHGSIEQVVAYYGGQATTTQIKEAIAYAQDFIEAVCEPPEADG